MIKQSGRFNRSKQLLVKAVMATTLTFSASLSAAIEVDKTATYKDSKASIKGIDHIGLSVTNLDEMLAFYQKATNFPLLHRQKIKNSPAADALFAMENVELEIAVLQAPNMRLELMAFSSNIGQKTEKMPFSGPGMTHTCYQSPDTAPAYQMFKNAGADILSRGEGPVDIGGYGVTYAYAYDPEGNMLEMEQLSDTVLKRAGYDASWQAQSYDMWMSQVALVSHDIERLMGFYQTVLGFKPYRIGEYQDRPKMDDIVDHTGLHLKGGWFKMGDKPKVLELWQFKDPITPERPSPKRPADLGYSFSIEVGDINKEYQRLKKQGVHFFSEPQRLGQSWQVYARDIDGNVFTLRQLINPET